MGGFDIVEHGRRVVEGVAPVADLAHLADHGITALSADRHDDVAAVLYLRNHRGTRSSLDGPPPASELEVVVFRTEPEWEPSGLSGSSEPLAPADLLRSPESHYPARHAFSYVSHDDSSNAHGTKVTVLRCHPEVGSVRHGCREYVIPEHGWLTVIVKPQSDWLFIDRDGSPIGPGPFS